MFPIIKSVFKSSDSNAFLRHSVLEDECASAGVAGWVKHPGLAPVSLAGTSGLDAVGGESQT